MASLSPLLTATPTTPPTYNVGMAETFSWVPVEGAGRPLYARATYLANPEDITVSLSAGNINVNLDDLELNTDELEGLIKYTNNTLSAFKFENNANAQIAINQLKALTGVDYATSSNQQISNSLLTSLTALQENKQNQIITLLHAITGTSFDVDLTTDQINLNIDQVETLLNNLTATNIKVPGFSIPPYDEINLSYYGSTNNIASVSYINNATTVLSLSFVYVTTPPTQNDALLTKVKKL